MTEDRQNQFKIRLSDEEIESLRELAEKHGITASDYLRIMIDREMAASRELERRSVEPIEFSYQAELVRQGIVPRMNGGKR